MLYECLTNLHSYQCLVFVNNIYERQKSPIKKRKRNFKTISPNLRGEIGIPFHQFRQEEEKSKFLFPSFQKKTWKFFSWDWERKIWVISLWEFLQVETLVNVWLIWVFTLTCWCQRQAFAESQAFQHSCTNWSSLSLTIESSYFKMFW